MRGQGRKSHKIILILSELKINPRIKIRTLLVVSIENKLNFILISFLHSFFRKHVRK